MSEKALEIFRLCERLAELLGDKEAIADLKILYERHLEMFENKEDVKKVISRVVSEPDIIVKNPIPFSEKDYIVGKKLDDEKMGEVGIRKDENIAKIFHANKKRLKNMDLLAKKEIVVDGRDAHTPYTQAQSLDGRLVENNISSTSNETIPNPSLESQIQNEEKLFDEMLKTQEKINDMPRVKDFKEDFEKDLEQSFNVETSEDNLQKDTKEQKNLKLRIKQ